jgi:hypothetical protein
MPCRCRQLCKDERVRCGMLGCKAYKQSSSGSSVYLRKATTTTSSSFVRTVERTSFGPIGASLAKPRFLHLATVFGLIPYCSASNTRRPFGAHPQLVVVWIEYLEAILRGLREWNAMPRIFVRAVGAGLGFAGPSWNFKLGSARAHPFFAQSIFDSVHQRSSRPDNRNWTVILTLFGVESKALPRRRGPAPFCCDAIARFNWCWESGPKSQGTGANVRSSRKVEQIRIDPPPAVRFTRRAAPQCPRASNPGLDSHVSKKRA